MKQAILDTNFILTCAKQKIDFFEELYLMGISIIIPKEVIREIEKFKGKKAEADIALKILEKNKFDLIEIGKGHVDKKIIGYAKENPEVLVATLDKEMQDKISNKKIIIREKKRLEIK